MTAPETQATGDNIAVSARALANTAAKEGLWLLALYFLLAQKSVDRCALEAQQSPAPKDAIKKSPFIYDMR